MNNPKIKKISELITKRLFTNKLIALELLATGKTIVPLKGCKIDPNYLKINTKSVKEYKIDDIYKINLYFDLYNCDIGFIEGNKVILLKALNPKKEYVFIEQFEIELGDL